jgi:hypothetical protein
MIQTDITYGQLDRVLSDLGFTCQRIAPKWLRYDHTGSDTFIVLVEKNKNDPVRITDAVSARRHLIEKGLIGERELDLKLASAVPQRLPLRREREP